MTERAGLTPLAASASDKVNTDMRVGGQDGVRQRDPPQPKEMPFVAREQRDVDDVLGADEVADLPHEVLTS
jgi:hypothetical protein